MTTKEEVVGVVVKESPEVGPRERVGADSQEEEEMSEEGSKVAEGVIKGGVRTKEGNQVDSGVTKGVWRISQVVRLFKRFRGFCVK